MTPQHLDALHASVEQASGLPARPDWERKASTHAELFNLLGDLAGDGDLAPLVNLGHGAAARPRPDGRPGSRRHHLELAPQAAAPVESPGRRRRGPGDGAAPQRPALHGPAGLRSQFGQDHPGQLAVPAVAR